jgi:hypothetical protein
MKIEQELLIPIIVFLIFFVLNRYFQWKFANNFEKMLGLVILIYYSLIDIKYGVYFGIVYMIYLINLSKNNIEGFDENENDINIVVSRYSENLEWLKDEPFNKHTYIVYNKGDNDDYYKSDKFKEEIKLKNVGRESHTYLSHIINNYDNKTFAKITVFLPGSVELEHKYNRAKQIFNEINAGNKDVDLFSCVLMDKPVRDVFKNFTIDKYLSSNNNNKINNDDEIYKSNIRPFGKWYEKLFNNINNENRCFTQNAMFAITKDTILKKPKSYYMNLIKYVDRHHNHESGHYFERAWDAVFFPYKNVKYLH